MIPIVGFVVEKYNKQRRRETIQCGGNIMIFLNQIVMSINIIYSKTEINHLLISEKLKIKPDLLLKYRNHLLTKLITETNKNKTHQCSAV